MVLVWRIIEVFGWRRLFLELKHPLLHPILWATVAVALLLAFDQHPVSTYREETAPLVWWLGPAVVAMAIPIWQRRELILAHWRTLLLVVILGMTFSAGSMLLLAPFVDWQEAKSLIPKSVTTPVAVGIAEEASSGRPPHEQLMEPLLAIGIMISDEQLMEPLLAIGIMISPLSGAVLGPLVLRIAGVRDHRAVGLALGCTSIGMGVARAFEIDATAGAFASVGMSLTAVCAGFILPWLLRLI